MNDMFLFRRKALHWFGLFMNARAIIATIPPLRGARGVLPISSAKSIAGCKHLQRGARKSNEVVVRENTPLKGGIVLWLFAAMFSLLFVITSASFAQSSNADSLRAQESISLAPIQPKKSPNGAVLRSLLVPGWGQYYNGQKWKAALVCAAELGELGTAIYWHRESKRVNDDHFKLVYEDYRNAAYWFLAGTIILSMLDAYVDAQLSDFDESPSLDDRTLGALAPPQPVLALRVKIRL